VIIGSTPLTGKILKQELPNLEYVPLPSYAIRYSKFLPLWFKLLLQYPRIKRVMKEEYQIVNALVHNKKINIIISDNRYGLYSKDVRSVIICHQINLIVPFLKKLLDRVHVRYLKRFNEVWVPDFEKDSDKLAGELSMNRFGLNCKYIGPLSRLQEVEAEIKYDQLFLLSGPEPSQTLLLKLIAERAGKFTNKQMAMVTSSEWNCASNEHLTIFKLPTAKELSHLIAQSETIVCRSGYSTLMDLFQLKKAKAVLIPTKGQTEQEYLARYWSKKFGSVVLQEEEIENYNF